MRFHEWVLVFLLFHLALIITLNTTGMLISSALVALCLVTGTIAQIAESVEKSKVPRTYFRIIWACVLSGFISLVTMGLIGMW